ncbi:hypothetical protein STSP_47520 [Streptomyces jeddahensis]|uniref:Uncharacterized protein n=1 Tax=Streptomyces jeddahensis TaxID=1716141 RepID=A0A177HLI6_9ACTN|nr:hypothetical protein STSP_47520 [Streptomyces jeddahensis]
MPSTPFATLPVASDVSVGEGLGGGGALFRAVDSVNGSGPVLAAGWRKISPCCWFDVPSGRVKTTISATAATMAAAMVATRGTDLHQGRRGPSPAPPPRPRPRPPPPGGSPVGGLAPLGGGGVRCRCEGPESGPVGGPVGRSDGGGSTFTSSLPCLGACGSSGRIGPAVLPRRGGGTPRGGCTGAAGVPERKRSNEAERSSAAEVLRRRSQRESPDPARIGPGTLPPARRPGHPYTARKPGPRGRLRTMRPEGHASLFPLHPLCAPALGGPQVDLCVFKSTCAAPPASRPVRLCRPQADAVGSPEGRVCDMLLSVTA